MKNKKVIFKKPIEGKENYFLEGELYYSLGGTNFFTCTNEPRGYYFSVSPIEITEHMRCFSAFSGFKSLIQPAKRFNQKELDKLEVISELQNNFINLVLKKNNLTLKAV